MNILSRYILKEYLRIFLITGLTLLSLFIIISLFDLMIDALGHGAGLSSIVRYLLFKLPQALYYMAPVIVLISTILHIGVFSKSNEIIAMKACGISIFRIALPIFTVTLIVWIFSFLNGEYLLPDANREQDRIRHEEIKKGKRKMVHRKDKLWFRSDDGSVWDIGLIGNDGKSLRNITRFQFGKDGLIEYRTDSKKVEWKNGKWEFTDCWVRSFKKEGGFNAEYFNRKYYSIKEKPSDFIIVKKNPDQMSYMEIRAYIKRIKREGLDPTRYQVDMQGKLSFPFICFIMALLGVPFALRTGRQGGVTMGIGIGVSTGFTVWFIYSMGLSLGRAGKIPVLAASWGSNIIFTIVGLYLILSSE